MPIQKKTIQKKKTSKVDTKIVSDFKKTYADAIVSVCRYLTHNDDSSINYHRLSGRSDMGGYGSVTQIYQASRPNWDNEIDNANIIFIVDKSVKLSAKTKNSIKDAIEEVNELLIEDFKEMMEKTDYEWYRQVNEKSVSSILDLNNEMHSSSENKWSFSFTPIDDIHGSLRNGWIPKRVKEVYGEFSVDDEEHNRDIWRDYGYESEEDE